MPDKLHAYGEVMARIARAAQQSGRSVGEVTLVAVTKTQGPEAIRPLLDAGHRVFGENRVQEAKAKWEKLRVEYPDVELHLIGPLQSNKAGEAVALFDVIETLDRDKLAKVLAMEMKRQKKSPELYVQVNTGLEPQKAGISPAEAHAFLCRLATDHQMRPHGLMCIPPTNEAAAGHFSQLARLARENALPHLSMGMSGDFEEAIAHGATHVRIGSALFGHRS